VWPVMLVRLLSSDTCVGPFILARLLSSTSVLLQLVAPQGLHVTLLRLPNFALPVYFVGRTLLSSVGAEWSRQKRRCLVSCGHASRCICVHLLQDKEAVASFCSSTLGQELATQELAIGGETGQEDWPDVEHHMSYC
jgi:hypothetical protein